MPFPIFLRLLRRQSYFLEEEYDYGTDWTDFAAGLETVGPALVSLLAVRS